MASTKFESLDAYLKSLDSTKATTIAELIAYIQQQFPELSVKIAWNVPQLHKGKDYVVGIAAFKKHITFSPWSAQVLDAFRERLSDYVVFKNCFQIPVDWSIDKNLVQALVQARLAELPPTP